MIKVSKIYKCRSCEQNFTVEEEGKGCVHTYRIITSEECPNCCLPSTNGARTVVIADLIKYIVLE